MKLTRAQRRQAEKAMRDYVHRHDPPALVDYSGLDDQSIIDMVKTCDDQCKRESGLFRTVSMTVWVNVSVPIDDSLVTDNEAFTSRAVGSITRRLNDVPGIMEYEVGEVTIV